MKKLLLFLLLSISGFISAQIQDLATLASGKLVYSTILYNTDDQVYGYIYFFDQGDIDKENKQLEYVLLDKNLNKVANNTFTYKNYKHGINFNFTGCNFINQNEIMLRMEYSAKKKPTIYTYRIIKFNDKKISPEYWYKNETIEEAPKNYKEYEKHIHELNNLGFFIPNKENNGFLVKELFLKDTGSNKFIKFYSTDNEQQWVYDYSLYKDSDKYINISLQESSLNTLYLFVFRNYNYFISFYQIIALNSKNGKKKYDFYLPSNKNHTIKFKEINNHLVITGNYSPTKESKGILSNPDPGIFNLEKNEGFYSIVLDEEGNKVKEKYTQWEDFKEYIKIEENGRIDKNYRLKPADYFVFDDGSISILTEKSKPSKYVSVASLISTLNIATISAIEDSQKAEDFILFSMDSDFNIKKVEIIEKDLTKDRSYNYLFSQYKSRGNEAAFFYQTYLKSEKEWILSINSINSNGIIKEDKIPMSSKDEKFTILPIPAKEGYILLREYNEIDEKYNQLRLEKLN
ncbi:hypothetical protein ETU09_05085 [Apibacter muscae]|uniref:Uncharacterized protein n=1 Tax=Apibacter muscae TaxID=2509004 RepID=A0A563DFX5_9FLAO|nr:hypothetical protein [Apibacter muscae]TWP28694.1 hypothetical protein ETU09_05085 [Apibacter muscae]